VGILRAAGNAIQKAQAGQFIRAALFDTPALSTF
jgi:hypothetical protein